MERKNFAVLCAAVLCFWLFALAFGTAQGKEEGLERFRETLQPETEKSILTYIVKQARLFFKRA